MNKIIFNHHQSRSKQDTAPANFKLDEIQWDNQYPVHPELIPFENSTRKIIQGLEQERAQVDNKL